MIDLSINFKKMEKSVDLVYYLVDDDINPLKDLEKFSGFDGLDYLSKKGLKMSDAKCISSKYIQKLLTYLPTSCFKDSFRELQYNSFMHGNKWDKSLFVRLKIGIGNKGLVAQIIDSGEGFDYKENFRKDENYFSNKGSGFREFKSSKNCIISWEGKGNISNLMMKINNNDLWLWKNGLYLNQKINGL